MTTSTRRPVKPRFVRCDFCGRNAHKVVTRDPDGTVRGTCPSCWDDDSPFGAKAQNDKRGGVVVADNRWNAPG